MTSRPFQVLGIQQVAIGGEDKNRLKKLWVDMLGLSVQSTFVSERENVDEDICAMGKGAFKVEVDLMQPVDPEKKPAVHTTPLRSASLPTVQPSPSVGISPCFANFDGQSQHARTTHDIDATKHRHLHRSRRLRRFILRSGRRFCGTVPAHQPGCARKRHG